MKENKKAFPYKGAPKRIKEKYKVVFALKKPLKERLSKSIFDKIFATMIIILSIPVFAIIYFAYFLNALIYPEDKGPVIFSYVASSCGKVFHKHKIRVVKVNKEIVERARKSPFYSAYPSEWKQENLTHVGKFLKRCYLDELPQIFNVLKGDISFVGPRSLAWRHYKKDIENGNINRKVLKAGLFSESHVRKGTPYFCDPDLEYGYIEKYMKLPALALLWTDIKIIARGIKMILERKGY